ncbi:hypothetical protein ACH5RR_012354 [Cinchona calisaya]|uniref:F-box protein n=1 Tax=Cinchona calisaya TaxID=153742 RepID=A0ABD3A915_9GENT
MENEVWVMKEDSRIGGGITWIKQLVFPAEIILSYPLRTIGASDVSRKYLMASFEGRVFSCDPNNQNVENQNGVVLDGSKFYEYVVADYVASLFSVIPPPLAGENLAGRDMHNGGEMMDKNKSNKSYSNSSSFLSRMFNCFCSRRKVS